MPSTLRFTVALEGLSELASLPLTNSASLSTLQF
ncbi:hypothetical protein PIIN_10347 [Serendipita indica DSM 11827]|uniref:Uncharacterized protein n=1 Tax=Serendipita indica (strain DSM 11827) TaxID=1109443 RepID=G4TYG0_SERID|nr:hypothetical protein PIIN_10347 [Serendipita indica DSM 11827]